MTVKTNQGTYECHFKCPFSILCFYSIQNLQASPTFSCHWYGLSIVSHPENHNVHYGILNIFRIYYISLHEMKDLPGFNSSQFNPIAPFNSLIVSGLLLDHLNTKIKHKCPPVLLRQQSNTFFQDQSMGNYIQFPQLHHL